MGIPQYDEARDDGPTRRIHVADPVVRRFGRLNVLDDLIRLRAADAVQEPILAYPRPAVDGAASYECFTGQDLDWMVDQGVCQLIECGFRAPRKEGEIVALLSLSDLDMIVSFFALSRLGYTVMMLSPRLSAAACVSLLDVVGCDTILYGAGASIRTTMVEILRLKLVTCRPIINRPSREEALDGPAVLVLHHSRNPEAARARIALILHSSGSTGTPKPLFLTHQALLTHPLRGPGLTSFNSLPWYHLHGLSTALQAMYMRRTAFLWDASLPLTAGALVAALDAARPQSVQGVPYVLQLLVDSRRGLEALRRCQLVTYGGAPCPDALGDRLVAEGVRFGGSFGLTEAGLVAESISRPPDDPGWNYLRFFDNIRQHVWMKPIGDSLYECVYLAGHPALTTSNSCEPPGSYHSRDVFAPHPSLPDRWKYISRLDDRVTLVNGEKVLPLPIEGAIKQHPLVHEAVVVGVNQAVPGLLLFPAPSIKSAAAGTGTSTSLSDQEYLDLIWPTIADANSRAEQFSQIARDMVCVLPAGAVCPHTDKGSMIRAQVYTQYAETINTLYARLEASTTGGAIEADIVATQRHLLALCERELGFRMSGVHAQFFAEGVDSLKAIHLRRLILRDFKIGEGKRLGQNVVFETGCVARLAEYILALQEMERHHAAREVERDTRPAVPRQRQAVPREIQGTNEVAQMQGLIDKYSTFHRHTPTLTEADNKSVILTGATGSTGAHTLYRLLNDHTVSVVYCLTRRANPKQAILDALAHKNLSVVPYRTRKIVALTAALDQPDLGLDAHMLAQMRQSVSLIVHTAWPVNFNLPLVSFEPQIRALHNLIQFSLSVEMPQPAVLLYCSSVSAAMGLPNTDTDTRTDTGIDEKPINSLHSALDMGYGRSKLVGERLVSAARRQGARAFSLRIGQVSGHSKKGLWNDSEAIPLMVRSALTLKALPALETACSWLPVDKLAYAILEIARACSSDAPPPPLTQNEAPNPETSGTETSGTETSGTEEGWIDDSVYNVSNSRVFSWSSLLAGLRRSGFVFRTVPFAEWLQLLKESEARGEELVNPAVKLVDHYEAMYSQGQGMKTFITDKAERDSMTLRNGRMRIIQDGILARYAQDWLRRWKT